MSKRNEAWGNFLFEDRMNKRFLSLNPQNAPQKKEILMKNRGKVPI